MSDRASQLSRTADRQISQLIDIFSANTEAVLQLPCPGREKLGDGTVAACAQHTIDTYHRLAAIAPHGNSETTTGHSHDMRYSAENVSLPALLAQLSAARGVVGKLADVEDGKLDSVPAAGILRFADGQRTLEQVLAAALKHQAHQVAALKAAVGQA